MWSLLGSVGNAKSWPGEVVGPVSVQQLMLESLGVFRAHVPPVTYVARMGHVNYCNRNVRTFD